MTVMNKLCSFVTALIMQFVDCLLLFFMLSPLDVTLEFLSVILFYYILHYFFLFFLFSFRSVMLCMFKEIPQ